MKFIKTTDSRYKLSADKRTCVDIDECSLNLCSGSCTNLPGSYRCGCETGFILDRQNNKNCEDIDECLVGTHNCGGRDICVNTWGGFKCVKVECPAGYEMIEDQKRYNLILFKILTTLFWIIELKAQDVIETVHLYADTVMLATMIVLESQWKSFTATRHSHISSQYQWKYLLQEWRLTVDELNLDMTLSLLRAQATLWQRISSRWNKLTQILLRSICLNRVLCERIFSWI